MNKFWFLVVYAIVSYFLYAGGLIAAEIMSHPQNFSCRDQSAWLSDKVPQRWLLEALK